MTLGIICSFGGALCALQSDPWDKKTAELAGEKSPKRSRKNGNKEATSNPSVDANMATQLFSFDAGPIGVGCDVSASIALRRLRNQLLETTTKCLIAKSGSLPNHESVTVYVGLLRAITVGPLESIHSILKELYKDNSSEESSEKYQDVRNARICNLYLELECIQHAFAIDHRTIIGTIAEVVSDQKPQGKNKKAKVNASAKALTDSDAVKEETDDMILVNKTLFVMLLSLSLQRDVEHKALEVMLSTESNSAARLLESSCSHMMVALVKLFGSLRMLDKLFSSILQLSQSCNDDGYIYFISEFMTVELKSSLQSNIEKSMHSLLSYGPVKSVLSCEAAAIPHGQVRTIWTILSGDGRAEEKVPKTKTLSIVQAALLQPLCEGLHVIVNTITVMAVSPDADFQSLVESNTDVYDHCGTVPSTQCVNSIVNQALCGLHGNDKEDVYTTAVTLSLASVLKVSSSIFVTIASTCPLFTHHLILCFDGQLFFPWLTLLRSCTSIPSALRQLDALASDGLLSAVCSTTLAFALFASNVESVVIGYTNSYAATANRLSHVSGSGAAFDWWKLFKSNSVDEELFALFLTIKQRSTSDNVSGIGGTVMSSFSIWRHMWLSNSNSGNLIQEVMETVLSNLISSELQRCMHDCKAHSEDYFSHISILQSSPNILESPKFIRTCKLCVII